MKRILYPVICFLLFTSLTPALQAQTQLADEIVEEIGRSLEASGRKLVEIIDYYTQTLNHDPRNGSSYANRAAAYFNQGEYQRAIHDYTRAITYVSSRQKSRMARMHYKRGLCYYIMRDYDKAEDDFTRAISYRPDVTDSYYFRGKILQMVYGQERRASNDFEKVISLSHGASVQEAYAKFFLGDMRAAASEIRDLLERVPRNDKRAYAAMHYNMAGIQALMGNVEETVRYLGIALSSGYNEHAWLERDPNFESIAHYDRFQELLSRYGLRYNAPRSRRVSIYDDEPRTRETTRREYPRTRPVDRPRAEYPRSTRSTESPSAPAALIAENLGFRDENNNNRIDAGERTYITFTLTNEGYGPARDLNMVVQELEGVSGLEFDVRTDLKSLEPGRSQEVELLVLGGNRLESGTAAFELQIQEKYGFDADPMQITIPTQAYQPPVLTVADHQFASEMGGAMRLGVPLTLKLAVQNTGAGTAEDVKVVFQLPENVFSAGDKEFSLGTLRPGASEVIDFEFFTNRRYEGREVPIRVDMREASGQADQSDILTVKINERLAVSSTVTITARPDAAVESDEISLTSDVDQRLPRTSMRKPNAVAVIIGNRDYENMDVPSVDFALQDAASMRNYLIESFGYDENNIIFMPNATQADFNGVFGTKEDYKARLFNLVKDGETDVFIYYSGHGAPDVNSEEGFFVPVDCDPSLVKFNGYGIETFYNNLSKIPYRNLTVVIDACFSGSSDRGTLLPYTSLVRVKSNSSVLKDPRAAVFTASQSNQVASWYPDQSHSLFTYYFLKGLQGEANEDRDRNLTVGEMRRYLEDQVPYMARRLKNREQNPEVFGRGDNILLTY
ncbi:MAG: caspase family protein [Bacteroidota bacterium]